MGIRLCVICCFFLAAFNICSLCLIFVNSINMYLGVFRLGFILFGTHFVSWTGWLFPSPLREVFNYYLLKNFFTVFLFVLFLWEDYDSIAGVFITLSQKALRLSSFLFFSFPFFLSDWFIYTILSSTSLMLSSASAILLLVPSRVFVISFIALFIM